MHRKTGEDTHIHTLHLHTPHLPTDTSEIIRLPAIIHFGKVKLYSTTLS